MSRMSSFFAVICMGLAVAFSAACFRQDIRTLVIKVPQMKTQDCGKLIQDAFARIDGVTTVEPDLTQHTMTVTYDARKLSIRNVEFVIAGLGFDANDIEGKAEAKAALPPGCR